MNPSYVETAYLYKVFDINLLRSTVDQAAREIRKFAVNVPFDAIAFTGVSGAALAFPLSYLMNKPVICVRKKGTNTHSALPIEGLFGAKSYIIVDDCIDTGKTVTSIRDEIRFNLGNDVKLVGIYLYHDCMYRAHYDEIPIIGGI